ncbi:rRNA maturation RNase YbeY [Jiella marina]|uniref:rRNA maturation RNase YbeY n=1 Tax=Jiella sp. LLJ827 TaxID=2917712 RepID=UPI002100EE88|nr:rRNA maturation RNase YbeY [Jiella sp. LLJ827]MCQ0988587.1 rRNA maturation RNase YbeY [Jiella sp. LLJ827]
MSRPDQHLPAHPAPDYSGLTIALAIETEAWETAGLGDLEATILHVLRAAARALALPADLTSEVAVTLADDATVRKANREWRGKDKPTNILSFPMMDLAPGDAPGPLAGDLLLAFETVKAEAEAENKRLHDHFSHLLVHGFLHLLGYDHEDDQDAEEMESCEIAILDGLGIANPYEETAP